MEGDEWGIKEVRRQARRELVIQTAYSLDGRDDKAHESHGHLTGLSETEAFKTANGQIPKES